MGNGYIDPPRLDEEEESITATLVIGWESNPLPLPLGNKEISLKKRLAY